MTDVIHKETYVHKNGRSYDVRFYSDDCFGPPWAESDCHGVIHSWGWNPTDDEQLEQHLLDYEPELEEETRLRMIRVLRPSGRWSGDGLYYDVMASLEKARKEWGCATSEEAMAVVEKDYAYLKGWCDDDWYWCTIGVAAIDDDGEVDEDSREYCGGYESTIIFPGNDEERAWRTECIEDLIASVEHEKRKALHKGQLELELRPA